MKSEQLVGTMLAFATYAFGFIRPIGTPTVSGPGTRCVLVPAGRARGAAIRQLHWWTWW